MTEVSSSDNNALLLQILSRMGHLEAYLEDIKTDVCEVKSQLVALNGTVKRHSEDIAVLKDWRASVASPAVKEVGDLRVQFAELAVKYGSLGGIAALVIWILKSLGVF